MFCIFGSVDFFNDSYLLLKKLVSYLKNWRVLDIQKTFFISAEACKNSDVRYVE